MGRRGAAAVQVRMNWTAGELRALCRASKLAVTTDNSSTDHLLYE